MHEFALDADELADALEAAGSGPGGASAADLSKARQALVKQAAKNPRRTSAISPDAMGPRFDASSIQGARAVSNGDTQLLSMPFAGFLLFSPEQESFHSPNAYCRHRLP